MSANKPIVVVGSLNIDLVARASRIPAPGQTLLGADFATHPGGKGANQAVAVARLGYPVRMIGRLGDDGFGDQLGEHLTRSGVDIAGVKTSPGSSGVAVIVVADTGENSIVVIPGANALLTPRDLDESIGILRSASAVLTQLETPLETISHLAALCRRESVPLILDPAPAQALPKELLSKVTWFTPNESEAAFYIGASDGADPADTASGLMEMGLTNVLLKLGSRGAYLAMPEGHRHRIPSFQVRAIDTTAAGDCFNGSFATGTRAWHVPSGKCALRCRRRRYLRHPPRRAALSARPRRGPAYARRNARNRQILLGRHEASEFRDIPLALHPTRHRRAVQHCKGFCNRQVSRL